MNKFKYMLFPVGRKTVRRTASEHGVIFITVTVIVMAMMILAITILSLNMSQTLIAEEEVKRVQAEMLAILLP